MPLLTLAAFTAGCASGGVRVASHHAVVFAGQEATARRVAGDIDAIADELLTTVPGLRARALRVHVDDPWRGPDGVDAYTVIRSDPAGEVVSTSIHLRSSAAGVRGTIAHELVHALLGPTWSTLPSFLEEGLCDYLAARIDPQSAARDEPESELLRVLCSKPRIEIAFTRALAGDAPPASTTLHVELGSAWSFEKSYDRELVELHSAARDETIAAAYAIGEAIVREIVESHAIDALHDQCLKARIEGEAHIDPAWVLAAAGLREPPDWAAWTASRTTAAGLLRVAEVTAGALAVAVTDDHRDAFPALGGREFLARAGAVLRLAGGEQAVDLTGVAALLQALDETWPGS